MTISTSHSLLADELHVALVDFDVSHVISLAFKLPQNNEDHFLNTLSKELKGNEVIPLPVQPAKKTYDKTPAKEWYDDTTVICKIQAKAQSFIELATATVNNKKIKFVVTHIEDDGTDMGADILIHDTKDGSQKPYQPPDKPDEPVCKHHTHGFLYSKDGIKVSWEPQDAVVSYTVLYQQEGELDQWNKVKPKNDKCIVDLKDLKPGSYFFKIRAHYREFGVCLDSEITTETVEYRETEQNRHTKIMYEETEQSNDAEIEYEETKQSSDEETESNDYYRPKI